MLGTISMSLCMLINMLGKYYSFFILKWINNVINQKKKQTNKKKKKKTLKFDMKSRVRLDRTYFVETENWKHCSKIIFKCMNSTVGPIFNEKVTEK